MDGTDSLLSALSPIGCCLLAILIQWNTHACLPRACLGQLAKTVANSLHKNCMYYLEGSSLKICTSLWLTNDSNEQTKTFSGTKDSQVLDITVTVIEIFGMCTPLSHWQKIMLFKSQRYNREWSWCQESVNLIIITQQVSYWAHSQWSWHCLAHVS